MPTFSSEAVIGGERQQKFYPRSQKRGHQWSINQCPPWGATQINKEGIFSLQLEDCLRTFKKKDLNHSLCHTYIYTNILQRLHLHLMAGRKKVVCGLLRQSERPHLGHKELKFWDLFFVDPFCVKDTPSAPRRVWCTVFVSYGKGMNLSLSAV